MIEGALNWDRYSTFLDTALPVLVSLPVFLLGRRSPLGLESQRNALAPKSSRWRASLPAVHMVGRLPSGKSVPHSAPATEAKMTKLHRYLHFRSPAQRIA